MQPVVEISPLFQQYQKNEHTCSIVWEMVDSEWESGDKCSGNLRDKEGYGNCCDEYSSLITRSTTESITVIIDYRLNSFLLLLSSECSHINHWFTNESYVKKSEKKTRNEKLNDEISQRKENLNGLCSFHPLNLHKPSRNFVTRHSSVLLLSPYNETPTEDQAPCLQYFIFAYISRLFFFLIQFRIV